jgi:hypothetical protein
MRDGVDYADLGGDDFDTHVMDPRLKAARLAQQLQALGYGSPSNTSLEFIFE